MKRLNRHAATLHKAGTPVVLAGDTNVVPTDRDIYPTKSYGDDALFQPASRKIYERLLAQCWLDAVRALYPDAPMYTFWDYMRKRWERDAGLRLDQILLSSAGLSFIGHLKDSLWSVDLFRCESILLRSHWVMVVMDVFTRRIIGFGVEHADPCGASICWMFNQIIAGKAASSAPEFRPRPAISFPRWLANLRILGVEESIILTCIGWR
jgi:Endonuclease/Exonuclease/phosphatase family